MRLLEAFNAKMNKVLCGIMFAAFAGMLIIAFLHMFFRYTADPVPVWTEPTARHLFIFSTYLGASIVFYEGKQINITFFTNLFTGIRLKALFLLIADAAGLFFTAVFTYQGIVLSRSASSVDALTSALPGLHPGLVYSAIPICCLFMFLDISVYTLRHIHSLLTGKEIMRATPYEI